MLKIAILYKRCGECWHQGSWHQVDSELQYEEREKLSNIKRGGHSHRQTKSRPPQSDDGEIIRIISARKATRNERSFYEGDSS